MNDKKSNPLVSSAHDPKLFSRLYKHFPMVKKYVKNNSGNNEDAHDVFQESLIILFRKLNETELELSAQLSTYLFAIAKNVWFEELRKRNKILILEEQDEEITERIAEESKFKKAENALTQLGERCKTLLIAFYHEQLSMSAIADKLSFSSAENARKQKYKCIQKAKNIYQSL